MTGPVSKTSSFKILVHAPNWVGDHAMAFPFYAALRDLFPESEILLIGRSWISDLKPDGFSEIVPFAGKELRKEQADKIRAQKFDIAFTLSPSFRSAWLLYRLGAAARHGFVSDMRGPLLTTPKNKFRRQLYNRAEHRALAYLRLLAPYLGPDNLPEDLFAKYRSVRLKALPVQPLEQKFALAKKARRVVICPGSTAASKKYPIGHFIRVIETIAKRKPAVEFVLLGAGIDRAECEAIAAHFRGSKIKVVSLCAQTTLREAHTLISAASAAIANDSGLAHITSLTATKLVTFNGMGRREETSPLTRHKTLFDLGLACSPCFTRECPRKDMPLACLTGIAPDAVAEAVLKNFAGGT